MSWITFLLMDNLVFSWKSVVKNTVLKTIVSKVTAVMALVNPLQWFSTFDDISGDNVYAECLGATSGAQAQGAREARRSRHPHPCPAPCACTPRPVRLMIFKG